jgi:hypothetical protein
MIRESRSLTFIFNLNLRKLREIACLECLQIRELGRTMSDGATAARAEGPSH